ncbi:MAG: glycosyltransferase family 1 protein, partial [Pseudomonadota bacterium]
MPRYFLDVSRTISRLHHKVATGIDRVERAYLAHLITNYPDAFAVGVFGSEGFLCALSEFAKLLDAPLPAKANLQDRVRFKLSDDQRRVKSLIRNRIGWDSMANLQRTLKTRIQKDDVFVSVGHMRNTAAIARIFSGCNADVWYFVHDLIPITHPHLVRSDTPEKFSDFVDTVSSTGTAVICNSQATAGDIRKRMIHVNPIVAKLGVDPCPNTDTSKARSGALMVGTIEPRKNYDLILDLWLNDIENTLPKLTIVGQRGWAAATTFKRIDKLKTNGRVTELVDASDEMLSDLYSSSETLLFPSFAEGFGLPLLEALTHDLPVIASDIPVFRELFGADAKLL